MFSGEQFCARLAELYRSMDTVYSAAAAIAGFSCVGCNGVKCCTVDLTLHSFMEMYYLKQGFRALPQTLKATIARRCAEVLACKRDDPLGSAYRDSVCVLNFDGLCGLYDFRPMICRLAGIRHTLARPDGALASGSGCARYEGELGPAHPEVSIDRTALYRDMAAIEMEVVRARGVRTRPLTVAETLEEHGRE